MVFAKEPIVGGIWRKVVNPGCPFIRVSAISVNVIDAYCRTAIFQENEQKKHPIFEFPMQSGLHMIVNLVHAATTLRGHLMGSGNFGRQARKERISVTALKPAN